MKRLLLLAGFTVLTHWAMGQTVGLRAGAELSDNRKGNNALGFGAYVNFDNLTDKFEFMLHSDYTRNKDELGEYEGAYIDYKKISVGAAGLYRMPLSDKIALKFGPDISYNWTEAFRKGNGWTVLEGYTANYAGIGLATNLHFQEVLKLPINLDFFMTPGYLIRTRNTPYNNINAERTLKRLNIQIGASYPIRKN